ncbi:MurR/RpiR family transcriptional regulator [Paenibacillus puldeungensis]|uniref:MurR/RpiR family transcriptional regulator n=1 Tax=Paenibacillus puldeungensis TaxID=696536 RepID=A0ABW3RSH1_9BACL
MFTPKQIRSFNEVELDMYRYILNHKNTIPYMTIREFAAKVHSSPTSVLRFCEKIGCSGFVEFKVYFKQMLSNEQQSKISYSDDKIGLFQDFLAKVKTPLFTEKLNKAIQMIQQRDKVFCLGAGPTGSIAYYAAAHFSASGLFAAYLDEQVALSATRLSSDLFILFCVSGESEIFIELVEKIKNSGGQTLLITNSNYSSLAKMADLTVAYNVYYARSLQKTVPTLIGHEDMDNVVDSFSTQLPAVYLIESLGSTIAASFAKHNPIQEGHDHFHSSDIIETAYDLSEHEQKMYHYTICNKPLIPYLTIREFAAEVHASPPSVLRFCHKLGFGGFKEFKHHIQQELDQAGALIGSEDRSQLFMSFLNEFNTTAYQEQIHIAAALLSGADRIYCSGDRASGSIAYYAAMYFVAAGKHASYLDQRCVNAIHQTVKEVYILFSFSGESEAMINFVRKVQESGGTSVIVTNNRSSTLSKLADFTLPYHLFHAKNMSSSVDDFSTQLPVVYLIETLAKMFFTEQEILE